MRSSGDRIPQAKSFRDVENALALLKSQGLTVNSANSNGSKGCISCAVTEMPTITILTPISLEFRSAAATATSPASHQKAYGKRYRQWQQEVDGLTQEMISRGDVKGAERLAAILLEYPTVINPAEFKVTIHTGCGKEVFRIIGSPGSDSQPGPSSITAVPAYTEHRGSHYQPQETALPAYSGPSHQVVRTDDVSVSKFLLFAEPVGISFSVPETMALLSTPLKQAKQQKLWLFQSQSGICFCIQCPCPVLMAESLDTDLIMGRKMYGPIPRHFHDNPLALNNALLHFQHVYYEAFGGGAKEMVMKYGSKVARDDGKELNFGDVIEHNLSVRAWHDQLRLGWSKLRTVYLARGARQPPITATERFVNKDAISGLTCLYSQDVEGKPREWVIICSYPDCTVPLLFSVESVQQHFQRHGLPLEVSDIHTLFGYQVIPVANGREVSKTTPPPPPSTAGTNNPLQQDQKKLRAIHRSSRFFYMSYMSVRQKQATFALL
ncbi:hypothetical protein HD806DRAFT_541545 [Xylariaceae sp. AK1471]|nr:hypothetical protein HD806DRAFT_541545 [Xylariaceae sp. AK1471]